MKKLALIIFTIIPLLSYSCTGIHQIKGKDRELIVKSLEKHHGINPSEVHIVAYGILGKANYSEVHTRKVAVPNQDLTSVTFKTISLSKPCLKLSSTYEGYSGIITLTKSELFLTDEYENESLKLLYRLKIDDFNNIAIPYHDTYEMNQIQIIVDEKNAIVLNAKHPPIVEANIYKFIKERGVREFNSCGVNIEAPTSHKAVKLLLDILFRR